MPITSVVSRNAANQLVIEGGRANFEDLYFPVNEPQIRDLIGKILTHVDAMGLPERVEKANKDLIKQALWRWFSDAQENSMTSYRGCIGPIEVLRATNGTERKYVWHAEGNHAVSVGQDEPAQS